MSKNYVQKPRSSYWNSIEGVHMNIMIQRNCLPDHYKKGLIVKSGTEVGSIKQGDTIYYDKRSGYSMIINDEQYTIIQEKDVVVVL